MKRATTGCLAAVLVGLMPCAASAEVMDKEPSLQGLWVTSLLLGLAGLLAWLRSRLLGILVTAVVLPLVWSFHWELTDPFVGRDILLEAGEGYVKQAYTTMFLCTVLHLAGIIGHVVRWRRVPTTKALPFEVGP